jgi:hypothetical protein
MRQRFCSVVIPYALPQKSSFIGFGFASCCEAWLCPAVGEFNLSYAFRLLHSNTLRAQPKTNYRSLTGGQSHASQQLAKPNPTKLDFLGKAYPVNTTVEKMDHVASIGHQQAETARTLRRPGVHSFATIRPNRSFSRKTFAIVRFARGGLDTWIVLA